VAEPIRFYLDQNILGGVAPGVRSRGIDIVSAQEAGRCGLSDPDQLAFATAEGRVLVTYDQDVLALHATGIPHAGIAWCHPSKYSLGQLIDALEILHGVLGPDEMVNHVEYL
jgi:hypothetical protein